MLDDHHFSENDRLLKQQLLASFNELQQATAELRQHLMADKIQATLPQAATWYELSDPTLVGRSQALIQGKKAFNLASKLYAQYEYKSPLQQARQTAMAVGYIMSGDETIKAARKLNGAKESFECLVVGLSKQKGFKNVYKRNQKVQRLLQESGLGRLCLQQVYRRIPIVEFELKRIAFAWVTKPALKKITPQEACELLMKSTQNSLKSQGAYQSQYQRLASLERHTPLVRELQSSTGMKARLSGVQVQRTSNGHPYYPRITASMPLLLAAQQQPPELVLPNPKSTIIGKQGGPKSQRGELLAPSINVWSKV